MDQDSISHGDVPDFITAPTPKCSCEPEEWESGPEEGEIVEDSSGVNHCQVSDGHFEEFQDKYADWSQKHESLWKQVQQLKESGQDEAASTLVTAKVSVMDGELQELMKAFGLVDAADMARKIHQKAERSRMSQPRWDDWATPEMVDLMQKSLPYEAERTTIIAALKECRGRVSYAIDYLMPGKGIADLCDYDPRYDENPPTPGYRIGCEVPEDGPLKSEKGGTGYDFPEDGPPAPVAGIDYDSPEDDVQTPTDVPPKEYLPTDVPRLEAKITELQRQVLSLKAQLADKGRQLDLPGVDLSPLVNVSHTESREQLLAAMAELRNKNNELEERLRDIRTIAVLTER